MGMKHGIFWIGMGTECRRYYSVVEYPEELNLDTEFDSWIGYETRYENQFMLGFSRLS